MKFSKKLWFDLLGIVAIIAGTITLVCLHILSPWAFILAAVACYPMAKRASLFFLHYMMLPLKRLKRVLPKLGAEILNTEWNEDKTEMRYCVKYKEEVFLINARNDSPYIWIEDPRWAKIPASDPRLPKMWEAINEFSLGRPSVNIVLSEPNENGDRLFSTCTRIYAPSLSFPQYLDSCMTEMLCCKPELEAFYHKERPYMADQQRHTVGFRMDDTEKEPGRQETPAAQKNAEVKN